MKMELNIVDFYSDVLNIYGDIGNLLCLKKRCQWRDITINQKCFSIGEDIDLDYEDTDLILIGGGSDRNQEAIANNFLNQRKYIDSYLDNDGVLLAVCGSYQMFGNNFKNIDGMDINCLEIFDMETIISKDRLIGDIILNSNIELGNDKIVGFENHGGNSYHDYNTLGIVDIGFGNNKDAVDEGLVFKNFIGTYLHRPLLPKNPHLADYLILSALKNKYEISSLSPLDD